MSSPSPSCPKPKNVLVVGGGPSGLVTLRNLIKRGEFEKVELCERRDSIGGVWYLDDPSAAESDSKRPRWPSPAYPGLIGNVLPEFLSFSHHPFPAPSTVPPFPTLKETYAYLQEFAEPLLASGNIRLNTEVTGIDEKEDGKWLVTTKDWSEGEGSVKEEVWDAVVLATCWYDYPVYPKTQGIEEAREKGLVKHSKTWKGPTSYEGKRVAVIANGNSANDMLAQLVSVAETPLYRSLRHTGYTNFPFVPDSRVTEVGAVKRYSVASTTEGDKLNLLLEDGSEILDIDFVLVGTGYGYAAPFVRVLDEKKEQLVQLTPPELDWSRVPSLHRHILYAINPTLAFIGLVMSFTPFIVSDVSSTWLTLAWAGSLPYPETVEERLLQEKEKLKQLEEARSAVETPSSFMAFHVLADSELEYARGLRSEIVAVREDLDAVLPTWKDEDYERRLAMYAIKYESLQKAREKGVDGITEGAV